MEQDNKINSITTCLSNREINSVDSKQIGEIDLGEN